MAAFIGTSLVGVAFLVAGLVCVVRERRFLRTAVRRPGRVTGHTSVETTEGSGLVRRIPAEVITFTTAEGRTAEITAKRRFRRRRRGTAVEVLHEPQRPTRGHPAGLQAQWGAALLWTGCALWCFALAAAFLLL